MTDEMESEKAVEFADRTYFIRLWANGYPADYDRLREQLEYWHKRLVRDEISANS